LGTICMMEREYEAILQQMDSAVRERITQNLKHYAPFLSMLLAWKEAIEGELEATQQRLLTGMLSQFLPSGQWNFPAQALAVLEQPSEGQWDLDSVLHDPLSDTSWLVCGRGHTLPIALEGYSLKPLEEGYLLRLSLVRTTGFSDLFREGQGVLIFVAGSEDLLSRLARSDWIVALPRQGAFTMEVTRYEGFLEFERQLGAARTIQRHLEPFLPPFYPYSRRFLLCRPNFAQPTASPLTEEPPNDQILIFVQLDAITGAQIASQPASEPLFLLNALPIIQAQLMRQSVQAVPFEVGEWVKVSFAGVQHCFFASAYGQEAYRRAWIEIESEPVDPEFFAGHTVNVFAEPNAEEVLIYYNSRGKEISVGAQSPTTLFGGRGAQFSVPYPAVGGNTFSFTTVAPDGMHYYLYHSLFRPSLLTQGDIIEILRHQPYNDWFDLPKTSLCTEVVSSLLTEESLWGQYLWPSVVSGMPIVEQHSAGVWQGGVCLTPILHLSLAPRRGLALPKFLVEAAAQHAASVIGQYFQIGLYKLHGRIDLDAHSERL
jgi:hypothetical protein